jgi:hypothetical protein
MPIGFACDACIDQPDRILVQEGLPWNAVPYAKFLKHLYSRQENLPRMRRNKRNWISVRMTESAMPSQTVDAQKT